VAFESRERWPVDLDLDLIRAVFEESGVEFIADLGGAPGVRPEGREMKPSTPNLPTRGRGANSLTNRASRMI